MTGAAVIDSLDPVAVLGELAKKRLTPATTEALCEALEVSPSRLRPLLEGLERQEWLAYDGQWDVTYQGRRVLRRHCPAFSGARSLFPALTRRQGAVAEVIHAHPLTGVTTTDLCSELGLQISACRARVRSLLASGWARKEGGSSLTRYYPATPEGE